MPEDFKRGMARTFTVVRERDISGISGTGVVAFGVQFHDGTVVMRWSVGKDSTVIWADLATAIDVHGHGGATKFYWDDTGAEITGVTSSD
jgi:3'-phosphoadenosine 5'-phosphosulfate sulfotransferase (PAPS reductase)/FAD synthetase